MYIYIYVYIIYYIYSIYIIYILYVYVLYAFTYLFVRGLIEGYWGAIRRFFNVGIKHKHPPRSSLYFHLIVQSGLQFSVPPSKYAATST